MNNELLEKKPEVDSQTNENNDSGAERILTWCKYAHSIGHKKGIIKGVVITLLVETILVCVGSVFRKIR